MRALKSYIARYPRNFRKEMGNFEFNFEEITPQIMLDFNGFKMQSFMDIDGLIITFYQED
jgi:hypothetical protein